MVGTSQSLTSETLRTLRKDLYDMDRLVPDEYDLLDAHADAMEKLEQRVEALEQQLADQQDLLDAAYMVPIPQEDSDG